MLLGVGYMKLESTFSGLCMFKSQGVCIIAAYMKLDFMFNCWVYEARLYV